MAKKYAIVGFIALQVMMVVASEKANSELARSTDSLRKSQSSLSRSQEQQKIDASNLRMSCYSGPCSNRKYDDRKLDMKPVADCIRYGNEYP